MILDPAPRWLLFDLGRRLGAWRPAAPGVVDQSGWLQAVG
jgi:hypothetical protein